VPSVTGLRQDRRGRITVELDGEPWRAVPVEVVVRCGLVLGLSLERERLRELGRELRRHRALTTATRALGRHDLSTRTLESRLERAGIGRDDRAEVLGTLKRLGLVDDERFALTRATALAERGHGNAAIRWELGRNGVPDELVARALDGLESEDLRAARIVARRGPGAATARLLNRRGFCAEAIEACIGSSASAEL
jgi:SOS response regulatory protein OraA/RecX